IITSDNPRSEDPNSIIDQIAAGIDEANMKKVMRIPDRKEAINVAINLMQPDDVLVIAGKGHENYQEIKGVKHHFDDVEIVKELINR
ncbi:MAG: UDP-N-acetylmuramoyl-L-alanyl-D-glutamate--2,6-diaminopimelate ligase, partial [Bacteroidales bacterium]|nr:UDP-N-acetylmuramoyl-L-alanyl-D-glutamate--2,6-diaminopimelate ligase [Bacteroidales bacterium]